ncbi:hypothetical protein D3C72_1047790 [compost metagenome]
MAQRVDLHRQPDRGRVDVAQQPVGERGVVLERALDGAHVLVAQDHLHQVHDELRLGLQRVGAVARRRQAHGAVDEHLHAARGAGLELGPVRHARGDGRGASGQHVRQVGGQHLAVRDDGAQLVVVRQRDAAAQHEAEALLAQEQQDGAHVGVHQLVGLHAQHDVARRQRLQLALEQRIDRDVDEHHLPAQQPAVAAGVQVQAQRVHERLDAGCRTRVGALPGRAPGHAVADHAALAVEQHGVGHVTIGTHGGRDGGRRVGLRAVAVDAGAPEEIEPHAAVPRVGIRKPARRCGARRPPGPPRWRPARAGCAASRPRRR